MAFWDIYDVRRLAWPTPWAEIFGRNAPLILEVGFGNGDHLTHLAARYPDHNLIGLEISQPSLRKASRKVKRQQLRHVRIIHATAHAFLWLACPPSSLDQLHINFPDPWPKEDHHSRRLISLPFLHLTATRLMPGAWLNIATDHPDYQPVIAACLENSPFFHSRLPTTWTTTDVARFITKYERKAQAEGRISHYYLWQRNQMPAPDIFPLPPEMPMPHVIIAASLDAARVRTAFRPLVSHAAPDDLHVRLTALYLAQDASHFLVETYIQEEPFPQRVALRLAARPDGQWLVGLHDIGFPRVTAGVHFAVQTLADWMLSLDPAARVVTHNLPAWVDARPGAIE